MTTIFSECNFDYLIPPKEVFNVTHTDHYIQHGEGKKAVRKIFNKVPYSETEMKKCKEFEALIAKEKVKLPPDWTQIDTIRFMYAGKLDLKKSLKIMNQHLEWRESPQRGVLGAQAKKFMEEGLIYISGRDKQFRPIIIVNAFQANLKKDKLEDYMEAICFVLDTVRKYYFVPGKVENWVIIIENNSLGLLDFPTKMVKAINDITAVNYTSTLDKLYIMNPSSVLKLSWNMISGLIDPETASKISMLSKSDFPQLLERISADQLERRYGGTLPDRTIFWPPVNTLNQPPYTLQSRSNTDITKKTSVSDDSTQKRGSNMAVPEFKDEEAKLNKEEPKTENKVVTGTSINAYPLSQFGPSATTAADTTAMKDTEVTAKTIQAMKFEESSRDYKNIVATTTGVIQEDTATFGGDTKKGNTEEGRGRIETNYDTVPEQPEQTEQRVEQPVIMPQNKRIKSKLKQGPRRSLTEPRKEDDRDDDIDDFDGVENRKFYNVKVVDSSNDAEYRAIMNGNEDFASLDYAHSNNPSQRYRPRKPPGVTFGGVEVNEMSGMYTGKYSRSAVEEDGTMLEKESIGTGFCGFCKSDGKNSRRYDEDSGCNIF